MAEPAKVVKADPTKDFFISMLVRDIGLIPAIVDLVDNSVDGARRLRPKSVACNGESADGDGMSSRFDGLWINLRVGEKRFEISDNCGGIPWEIAENYAFRFGRPEEAPETPNSIGQFGIGMKRALFKLGHAFVVDSTTQAESFRLSVDVEEWRKQHGWVFSDVAYAAKETKIDKSGTHITVEPLNKAVSETFSEARFKNELSLELSRRHQGTINDGLAVSLNTVPINVDVQKLLNSEEIKPAFSNETLDAETSEPVHVEIYAGIEASSPADAGWYVYCNGRLILGPDRTIVTGWGEGKGRTMPQYHNQFARFRGYVFFESADVEKLPWTTTKEGVDQDHPTFRATRPKMLAAARPVIDFLNALDAEKDRPVKDALSLEQVVTSAESSGPSPLSRIIAPTQFVSPTRAPLPREPESQSIQYRRPLKQINKVKKKLRVSSAKEAGAATFDYYYRRECSDDE